MHITALGPRCEGCKHVMPFKPEFINICVRLDCLRLVYTHENAYAITKYTRTVDIPKHMKDDHVYFIHDHIQNKCACMGML